MYSELRAPGTAAPCDDVNISVVVTNTGNVTSDEVVQVYASLPDATVPAPRIRLAAFERIKAIAPAQRVRVELTVSPESHAVVLDGGPSVYDANVAVQCGRLQLSVGGGQPQSSSGGTLSATVMVSESSLVRDC